MWMEQRGASWVDWLLAVHPIEKLDVIDPASPTFSTLSFRTRMALSEGITNTYTTAAPCGH